MTAPIEGTAAESIADRLRSAIRDAGIPAEAVAAAFAEGGSLRDGETVERILSGDRSPSSLDIALIAELTGTDAYQLITGEPDPFQIQIIGPCHMPDWAAGD